MTDGAAIPTPPPPASTAATVPAAAPDGFRHVYYPYQGPEQYLPGALAYIESARADGAVVLVAAPGKRQEILREALPQEQAETVVFVDTAALGRNPGRLISAWREWTDHRCSDGQALRAVNDSIWPGATAAHQSELRYHERLLNLAFAQAPAWSLLCPYDTAGLPPAEARALARCHPLVWGREGYQPAADYAAGPHEFEYLPEPPAPVDELAYSVGDLAAVRDLVARFADAMQLGRDRVRDLKLAVSELMSNSIRHGGGRGIFRVWVQDQSVICEVRDAGVITDPLVGQTQPDDEKPGGRGLWFAHQLCDLVQIRSSPLEGTRIRVHMYLPEQSQNGLRPA